MIVGIEGPVLAGKSSLIKLVTPALVAAGVDCLACPCYVEAARRFGRTIPPGLPRTIEEELGAQRFFLEIDALRRPDRDPEVLLLDRTTWTLWAHLHALLATGVFNDTGYDGAVLTKPAAETAKPDVVLYLDVPWATQLQRSSSRGALPPPFLDRGFNLAFRGYFRQTQHEHQAVWLDAAQSLEANAAAVVRHVETLRQPRWVAESRTG